MNFSGVLKIFGGGKACVITARTVLGIILLSAAVSAHAVQDGLYTVTENWTVKIETQNSSPQVYHGSETGPLIVTNGQYSLIDHTGISGGDSFGTRTRTLAGGPPYTGAGEYPYVGWALATNGLVDVMHLGFFSVGVLRSSTDPYTPVSSKSSVFSITGNSLSGLSGSGTQDNGDYYYYTVTSTTSLVGVTNTVGTTNSIPTNTPPPAPFFAGQAALGSNWYYLSFTNGTPFGYYNLGSFPVVYHLDLGFVYFIDANNSTHGCYLYDFSSKTFFYTDPSLFPFLYDFSLNAWLWYYPNTNSTGRYTSGPRTFYNFGTHKVITK